MVNVVAADVIEDIVGVKRDDVYHYGLAKSDEQKMYILHSKMCKDAGMIKVCAYTRALSRGLDDDWEYIMDVPVRLSVNDGLLHPAGE